MPGTAYLYFNLPLQEVLTSKALVQISGVNTNGEPHTFAIVAWKHPYVEHKCGSFIGPGAVIRH